MPPPSGAAQKCRPGCIGDEQHLLRFSCPPMLRPVQSSSTLHSRVLTAVGVDPEPGVNVASHVAVQLALPPWNIGAPASGSRPPVNLMVPQQKFMPELQSSGPSQASAA